MSRFFRRRKFCRFTAEGVQEIDYKDLEVLKCEIKSILNESIITDLNSLNNHIDNNNFIKLLNEGYTKKTINSSNCGA